jgi:hypothetical protein
MSNKTAAVTPQDVPAPKTVSRTTYILTIFLTIFATVVIMTVANWFLYTSIHTDARAAVVQDMKIVSKAQEQ